MSKIEKPKNEIVHIHDETYYERHNLQNLNHKTMMFCRYRAKESLNGRWHFTIDPYDTGLRSDWNIVNKVDENGRRLPWDYETDSEETIPVPSCWNVIRPEYYYYEGSAWYAREFSYHRYYKSYTIY